MRSLILLHAPNAVDTARFVLWRDDPALEPLVDPAWHTPRAVVDWRVKSSVFPALKKYPCPEAEKLCRDYLALGDKEAARLGLPQFEPSADALLQISPSTTTALELLRHRIQKVRGRSIFDCLARAQEPWAEAALTQAAPFALAYRVSYKGSERR